MVFGLISAFSTTYEMLYWTRFIVGFWEGSASVAYDLLAEFMQAKDRGFIMNFVNIAFGVGAAGTVALAWWLIPTYGCMCSWG